MKSTGGGVRFRELSVPRPNNRSKPPPESAEEEQTEKQISLAPPSEPMTRNHTNLLVSDRCYMFESYGPRGRIATIPALPRQAGGWGSSIGTVSGSLYYKNATQGRDQELLSVGRDARRNRIGNADSAAHARLTREDNTRKLSYE